MALLQLVILLLIGFCLLLAPSRQISAPPPRTTSSLLKDDLIDAPSRWYAGAEYVVRFPRLYQVVPSDSGPLRASDVVELRVSSKRLEHAVTFGWLSELSKPFHSQAPAWSDYSISLGSLPPGRHELVVRCELVLIGNVNTTIAEREYRWQADVMTSLDELELAPFLSPELAKGLDARLEHGRLRLAIPDPFKPSTPLSIQVRKGAEVLATGTTYFWRRDPDWVRVVGTEQGDPVASAVDLNWKSETTPDLTGAVIELQGSPEVALRAGMRRYWAGRVLIPVRQPEPHP